ncbi:NAD(P)-dependent oxidoreductase [Aquabacterium sp.]|uniref:NAD(P)-dependent oxidoreductase n=1 Tax=Aquabacterium sp. TaxID=1872578 RepID=UPI0037853239
MNILLTGSWDDTERDAWAAALRAAMPGHTLWLSREGVAAEAIEAAIVANPAPGQLQGLPRLRLIQSLWAGVDRLLGDASLPAGVPIARMVDPAMNAAMAETALWAVLSLHRGFFRYARQQQQGVWQELPQRRADELHVLVLGLGQMGRTAALRLRQQGYRVSAWRRAGGDAAPEGVERLSGAPALRGALPGVDVLVNLLPLTPETRGLLDESLFAALPRGAGIVNLARGAHLDEAALLAALDSGQIGHAVLDVFQTEPLPAGHRFWGHPQVTLLPHAAAQTDLRSAAAIAAANLEALAAGRPLMNLVQPARGY